jgi:hypothetical protein
VGRYRRGFAGLTLVLFAGLTALSTTGVASAHEAGARHRWNSHLFRHAQQDFYTKAAVDRKIDALEPAPPAVPTDADGEDDGVTNDVLFPWVEKGGFSQNWWQGLGYALLGLLGAMVTIYLFLGESLPSMGGKADYDALRVELEDFKERREKNLRAREEFARDESDEISAERRRTQDALAVEYDTTISRLEAQLVKERWALYLMGFPIYLLLGGAFAVLLATNALQAILIGFGWTALADRMGLKREIATKQEAKDKELAKLNEDISEQAQKARDLKAKLVQVDEEKRRLEEANQKALAEIADVKKTETEKTSRVADLEKENEALKKESDTLKVFHDALLSELRRRSPQSPPGGSQ